MSTIRDALRSLPDNVKQSAAMEDGFITSLVRAGVPVDENTAMRLGSVFACVRNISQDFAMAPVHLYRRSGRKRERVHDHPYAKLLHDAANPEATAFQFKQAFLAGVLLWGNAYAYKERDASGRVVALWNLKPDTVVPTRDEQGELRYQVGSKLYTRYEILHMPGLGFDGVSGRSCIQYAREPVAIGLAAEELGARFFGTGAHLGGVITVDGELSDAAFNRTQKQFNEMYKGLENAAGVPVLEGGAKFLNTTMPLADMQYIETRKFSRNEIAMMFRMPPHKIGDLERATFSNIEQQDMDYYTSCLLPWFTCFEQTLLQQLVLDNEADAETDLYFKVNADAFLRASTADRYEAYASALNAQWITQNEVREKEDLNPLEGEEYDVPLQPLNMADKGGDPQDSELKKSSGREPEDAKKEQKEQKRSEDDPSGPEVNELFDQRNVLKGMFWPKLRDVRLNHMGADERAVLELAKEKHGDELKQAVIEYFGTRYEAVSGDLEAVLSPFAAMVLASAAAEVGKGSVSLDNPRYAKFLKSYCDRYSKGYLADSKRMVLNAVDAAEDDESESISDAYEEERGGDWPGQKAEQEAKDETNRALNALLVMGYILLQVKTKVWVGVGTSCPMCRTMIGKAVEVEKSFTTEGGTLEWTDDLGRVQTMTTHYRSAPPLHKGCDCQVQAAL